MTWNYRIVKWADGAGYGIHEVYYDDKGVVTGWTSKPVGFVGETPEEVRECLARAFLDASNKPVFEEPKDET